MGACKPLRIWFLLRHNRKKETFWSFLFLFLIFFNTNIALCFYHSIIAMKVIINSISGCRKFGGKAINFTVQRFCKESCVKHSETGD